MRIVTNEPLIRRNRLIAQVASLSGLGVLIGGMIISFRKPELVNLAFAALIIGFILAQIGIYFTNRWGRRPRPDEMLNQALKGLDNKYTIYHYTTPVSHLLVGPAGLWVLLPRHQRGTIIFRNGRWRQTGGGLLQAYLKLFAQEGLGRPDLEIRSDIENLRAFLEKRLPEIDLPPIRAALIFTSDQVEIKISDEDQPLAPTLPLSKLKDFIRKTAKGKPISLERAARIQQILDGAEQAVSDQEEG